MLRYMLTDVITSSWVNLEDGVLDVLYNQYIKHGRIHNFYLTLRRIT